MGLYNVIVGRSKKYLIALTEGEVMTQNDEDSSYYDLMPVDDADIKGGHEEALRFAIDRNCIKNIALR
ncbi:hypothetical protein [Pontiella sp.]|uniref:hypothetical protein n=1 Tax=Pontiella sp. TaxID=2837462 RepID=UPI0035629493